MRKLTENDISIIIWILLATNMGVNIWWLFQPAIDQLSFISLNTMIASMLTGMAVYVIVTGRNKLI